MISDKMKDMVKNGSQIRAMFKDGELLRKKLGAENVYDFSLGNPSIAPPESVKKAALDILRDEPEMLVHGYMNNGGYPDVRAQIAEHLNEKHGTCFSAENIIMTVGAAGGINVTLKTLLNAGDEVIIFAPYFGEYNSYIANYDGKKVIVDADTDNFSINFEDLERKLSDKTKAVIVNSPNNPTGAVYSEEDIRKLSDILSSKQEEYGTDIYIISDEPYREIVFGDTVVPYLTNYYDNTIVGYSYSKSLSVPGERIGYIAVSPKIADLEETLTGLEVANRILGFVNAPSLFQRVISRCLNDTSDVSVYEENKEILYKALKEYGYDVVEPKGTFYMFPKCFIADDKEFCAAAKEFGLVIVPGSAFCCPGYFRIAYCVEKETVLKSLESFKKLADKYR